MFKWFFASLFLTSCKTSFKISTSGTPTYFAADSSFFLNQFESLLFYHDLNGIAPVSRVLMPNKATTLNISHPTIFQCNRAKVIIYPGEYIMLSSNDGNELRFSVRGSEKRSMELQYLLQVQQICQDSRPQFPPRTRDYPIDTVLLFEHKIIAELVPYFKRVRTLIDSLAIIYKVSDEFKSLSVDFLKEEEFSALDHLYSVYATVLKENDVFRSRQSHLIDYLNNMNYTPAFDLGGLVYAEKIADNLLQKRISVTRNKKELRSTMDFLNANFLGTARDFLLTKLIYRITSKRAAVSKPILTYYYKSCVSAHYKSIIKESVLERKFFERQSKLKRHNRLINLSSSRIETLGDVIKKHRGELILIDVWASWCAPCAGEIPKMLALQETLPEKKVALIFLSLDKVIREWRYKNHDFDLPLENSYVLADSKRQGFINKYNILAIPRYILFDQFGEIINTDAPAPGTEALKILIQRHL